MTVLLAWLYNVPRGVWLDSGFYRNPPTPRLAVELPGDDLLGDVDCPLCLFSADVIETIVGFEPQVIEPVQGKTLWLEHSRPSHTGLRIEPSATHESFHKAKRLPAGFPLCLSYSSPHRLICGIVTPAVSRAKSRSEGRAEAVGVGCRVEPVVTHPAAG